MTRASSVAVPGAVRVLFMHVLVRRWTVPDARTGIAGRADTRRAGGETPAGPAATAGSAATDMLGAVLPPRMPCPGRPKEPDVWFSSDNMALTVAQAACIALPGAGLPVWAARFRAGAWALVLPLSIGVVVGAIAVVPTTADLLTWIALILVPAGAALGLGWAARGARPWLALGAAPLLVLAWRMPDEHIGQASAVVLIAASAVAAGRLIAGLAPLALLKAGVIAMAVVDAILVFSNNLQGPNAVLVAATPGPAGLGLPQLQSASFGHAGLGYGDFFAAAVVGAILAVERGPQISALAAMLLVTLAWDQLFLIYDVIPATIPPALVLVGTEAWRRRGGGAGSAAARASTAATEVSGSPRAERTRR
jgi:hypothetical protein